VRQGKGRQVYNPADKSLFVLSSDDAMFETMAATKVTVKGSTDKEKRMVTVTSMEPMAPKE
jgi:archaeosine-15-forming tRNA-guanine transglycosylase